MKKKWSRFPEIPVFILDFLLYSTVPSRIPLPLVTQRASDKGGGIRLGELRADLGNSFGAAIVRFREVSELRASSVAAQNRATAKDKGCI